MYIATLGNAHKRRHRDLPVYRCRRAHITTLTSRGATGSPLPWSSNRDAAAANEHGTPLRIDPKLRNEIITGQIEAPGPQFQWRQANVHMVSSEGFYV